MSYDLRHIHGFSLRQLQSWFYFVTFWVKEGEVD
jgi:hypothetical protein